MPNCSHCGRPLTYRIECFACHAEFCRACFETVIVPAAGLCPSCEQSPGDAPGPMPRRARIRHERRTVVRRERCVLVGC